MTHPDEFIKNRDLVIVIEGNRTKRKPRTSTKWIKGRHQMLRYIDCAWEIKGKRQVIAFFIVEGERKQEDVISAWFDWIEMQSHLL
jgi:hypothetical protein